MLTSMIPGRALLQKPLLRFIMIIIGLKGKKNQLFFRCNTTLPIKPIPEWKFICQRNHTQIDQDQKRKNERH